MANGQFGGLVADIPGAVQRGLQFQQAAQLRPGELQQQQLGLQRQQQQLAAGGLQQQALQQQIDQRTDDQKNLSLATGALGVLQQSDEAIVPFLEQRLASLPQGADSTQTQQALELARAGNIQEVRTSAQNLVDTATRQGILKAPPVTKQASLQFQKGGIIFDPNTGATKVDPVAKARLDSIAQKTNVTGKLDFKDKQSINKDITGLLKNTVGIVNTAKDLEKLGKLKGGPASIALVFKFMKALDPTSVVRESEFATAQNSAGIPEGIRNIFNKLQTGERLGEPQIKQFVEAAQALANTAIGGSTEEINGLLNTFGDTLPGDFKGSLLNRIPSGFEVTPTPAPTDIATPPQGPTTPGAQVEPVGDFTNQSNEQLLSF